MATVENLGYAVVSYMTAFPQNKDITGDGPHMDIPFESVQDAQFYMEDQGFLRDDSIVRAKIVALVEIKDVD